MALAFDYIEEDPLPFSFEFLEVGDSVLTGSSNPLYVKGEVVKVKQVGPRNNKRTIIKVKFPNGFFGWFGATQLVKLEGVN